MKVNVWNTILQLSKERDVEPRVIVQAIEESLRVAALKFFANGENIQTLFRPEKGDLRVFALKRVADPVKDPAREISLENALRLNPKAAAAGVVEVDLPADTLGRIAAQAAKQVIFQKVRDAEQEKIYEEFAPRIGELLTGVVRRVENEAMVLEVTRTEVFFPLREAIPNEEFRRGDNVKAVIVQVQRGAKGSQVIVSRASPRFLARLLENEIPEIANGQIEIKDIVRQPGERSKVAVLSRERDIDAVGACIGVKGNRILAVSKELGGEKIDIIPWASNPAAYAKAALSPARVDRVTVLDRDAKVMEAGVGPDQFSLAIGKKGLNVKLASRLTGWKISIRQEATHDDAN
jgi:N utilization substance protein A